MAGKSMRVATRMQLLVVFALAGLLLLCLTTLFQLKETMLEDRKQKTRNLVEVGVGLLTHYHGQVSAGKLSEPEAKEAAKAAIRGLRYAKGDYFFIINTDYVYELLPPKPEFEGTNKRDLKDANGRYFIQDLIGAAKAGGGYVEYWFPRAGQTEAEPKLSYATMFTPWNWMIGTGIYIDDVELEYRRSAWRLGAISGVLLLLLAGIGWRTTRSIVNELGGEPRLAKDIMAKVAGGDLTAQLGVPVAGSLLASLDAMTQALRQLVQRINDEADVLVRNAETIRVASGDIAQAAEHQADATASMAAAIEELTVSSSHISDNARESEKDSQAAKAYSVEGRQRVENASAAIESISGAVSQASAQIQALDERAKQISSIANVIKDIAGQTNLLALNAAIEAARAGEQGRGFAVVADEVRKLAERTALATTEIEQMLGAIQTDTSTTVSAMENVLPEVNRGVELANLASTSLHEIEAGSGRTLARVREVAEATAEQGAASTAIAQRVEQIVQMVEKTTETIQGTAQTASHLEAIAKKLKSEVAKFSV